jgi:small subunit ribosomal protein S20
MCAMIEKLRIEEVSGTVLPGGDGAHCTGGPGGAIVPPFPLFSTAGFNMANIASQIKRNRQNGKLRARNLAIRSELKTRIKKAEQAVEAADDAAFADAYREAQKRIDTAVAKGVLHKRTAARRKARLARRGPQPAS